MLTENTKSLSEIDAQIAEIQSKPEYKEGKLIFEANKSLTDIDKEFKLVDHSIKGIIKKYATKYHLLDFVKAMYNYYKMH